MTTAGSSSLSSSPSGPCIRCKEHPATLDLRTEPVCSICFAAFIQSKAIKRLEVLQRETRGPPTTTTPSSPQRYLVALSLGPSSTALLRVLCENARRQKGRGGRGGVRFDLVAVHVDTSCVDNDDNDDDTSAKQRYHDSQAEEDRLAPYRALFPEVADFRVVPLSRVLRDPDLDWSALPLPPPSPSTPGEAEDDDQRLRAMFARLPSPSARADVRRLLVRRALLATAACCSTTPAVLLLGYSTTALAELTLSETAKGRGFAVPAGVRDGVVRMLPPPSSPSSSPSTKTTTAQVHVYSPLRELFRKELISYLSVFPDFGLLFSSTTTTSAVVSHRDLSIDDVMARYFGEVEAAYPSVVANVVRTTGKLLLRSPSDGEEEEEEGSRCGLCGMGLDVEGTERWRGEIGEVVPDDEDGEGGRRRRKLCYGCERSVRG